MKKANTKRDNVIEVLVKVRYLNLCKESYHNIPFPPNLLCQSEWLDVSLEKYYCYIELTHSQF